MEEVEVSTATNGHKEVDSSLLAQLRAEREALTKEQHLDLGVPGYSALVARYKPIDYSEIRRIMGRADRDKAKAATDEERSVIELNALADILARCCEGMFLRNEEGDLQELHTLRDEWGDDPIVYDPRLAEVLGVGEAETARAVVHGVFATFAPNTRNDMVLDGYVRKLVDWVRGNAVEADQDF